MAGQVIAVKQDGGEIVVTFPGQPRVILPVADGQVTAYDAAIAAEVLRMVPGARLVNEPEAAPFDVDTHTVDEVNTYLDQHPGEADRVLAAERDGRARVGILTGPHAPDDE